MPESKDQMLFVHCKKCLTAGNADKIEVALGSDGVLVSCGVCESVITMITPESLPLLMEQFKSRGCDCCEGGSHHD